LGSFGKKIKKPNFLYFVSSKHNKHYDFILSSIYKLISANLCPPFLKIFLPSKRFFGFGAFFGFNVSGALSHRFGGGPLTNLTWF